MPGSINPSATKELEIVRRKAGGVLRPRDVVQYAKSPKTALHALFTWDDDEAATQWRLEEARRIIRASVVVLPQVDREVRCYVALQNDRGQDSYRAVADVLSDDELRAQMLDEARAEWQGFYRRYRTLKELGALFEAGKLVFG